MIYSTEEIVRSYREAKDPEKQIKVLADLNACTAKEIRQVLVGEGVLPRETEKAPEAKSGRRPRVKKPADAAPDAPVQMAADVEETEEAQDIAQHPVPEQRAVTVEELRSLLEDACKEGLGDCEILVEKTALADLWLEVHTTMHIYESGKRTVELKGTAKSA